MDNKYYLVKGLRNVTDIYDPIFYIHIYESVGELEKSSAREPIVRFQSIYFKGKIVSNGKVQYYKSIEDFEKDVKGSLPKTEDIEITDLFYKSENSNIFLSFEDAMRWIKTMFILSEHYNQFRLDNIKSELEKTKFRYMSRASDAQIDMQYFVTNLK